MVVLAQTRGRKEERPMSLQPLPVESPISGALWTLVIPALLFALSFLATFLLYRRFARQEEGKS